MRVPGEVLIYLILWRISDSASLDLMGEQFTHLGVAACASGPDDILTRGKHGDDIELCALMCLMDADCTHFSWSTWTDDAGNTDSDPCYLVMLGCNVVSHLYSLLYKKNGDATSRLTTALTVPSGWTKYPSSDCNGSNQNGHMINIDEEMCTRMCMLNEKCQAVTYDGPSKRECFSKTRCGALTSSATGVTIMRDRHAFCVPQLNSCYFVFSKGDGAKATTARHVCQKAGGHLASLAAEGEKDTLKAKNEFSYWKRNLWLDLMMSGGQWRWMTDDVEGKDLVWKENQPSLTEEGTFATGGSSTWSLSTPAMPVPYPLCELPYIARIWSGNFSRPLHTLSDKDLDTCYSPPTMMAAANIKLSTSRLNPLGDRNMLVKVHGSNITCSSSQKDSNVYVMNDISDDGVKKTYRMCPLYAGYMWRGKQLCLYQCDCEEGALCKDVYLKMDPNPDIAICEFMVL